jgi:GTPase SAR1 family protein
MLWDTAGQEEFDAITKAYYRGAQAAVLAFSTVDRVSFDAIRSWKKKVRVVPFFFLFLFWLRVEMMSLG